ncbi:MAG TPA: nitrilase-related carbon-nitrogen hydrolase, partial [Bacteroidota bacterium]|nr:nitrilase-related carbon-nitrogen hydrolase [Bacteroidota bacterium]
VAVADKAAAAGAQLVVFPELSLTGYAIKDMNWDLALNLRGDLRAIAPLIEKGRSISILAGGIEESDAFALHNAAFFFEGGDVRSAHRKTYPPTYGMFEENRYFSSGSSVRALESKHGRFGVLICEDLWHLPLPYLLAQDGAGIILTLVASPTRISGKEEKPQIATVNAENHRTYARLLSVFLAFCNRVGFEDGVNFWGGSEIVGPDGSCIVSARLFEEDLIVAEIDENELRRARRLSRHFVDDNPGIVERELKRIRKGS